MKPADEELASLAPAERDLHRDRRQMIEDIVMTQIHHDLSAPEKTATSRRPALRRRPALLAAALAGAVAAAVAVPAFVGGASPAYALSKNADGTITIQINEVKEPKKLQADLRGKGLNAVVDYIPIGKQCKDRPRARYTADSDSLVIMTGDRPGFTVDPSVVKTGQTAVLEFSVAEGKTTVSGIWAGVTAGSVKPCALVDSSGAPLGG